MRSGFIAPYVCLCLAAALTGCASGGAFDATAPTVGVAIQGTVLSGPASIAGAHVYFMKVSAAGYGSPAVSMLSVSSTGNADSVGAYVLTDARGNFNIPATFTCTGPEMTYLYVTSGSPAWTSMLAAVGECPGPDFGLLSFTVNEISTVATAYAIAGFAVDPLHVAISGTPLSGTGVSNAFNNAAHLYAPVTGAVYGSTLGGNGAIPSRTIDSLANLLAGCIQTSGPTSGSCATLFANASAPGGGTPSDTAAAILNIAHNPGAHVAALYAASSLNSSYSPAMQAQPNDFTLGINYSGGGLKQPYAVAIDAAGDAWFANLGNSSVSKFSSLGVPLSPAAGYVNGSPAGPVGIAIDLSGNAWIVNAVTSSLIKYASSGALLSPAGGYSGGGIDAPQAIASDALGNTWTANYRNSASKFSNGGIPISPAMGYTGGGILGAASIAIDAQGAAWIANSTGSPNSIAKLSNMGQAMSPVTGFTGAGLSRPFSIALDSKGYAWIANFSGNSLSKISSTGEPISSPAGFTGGGLSMPFSIALDGAGDVWVANAGAYSVSEFSNSGDALSPSTGYLGGTLNFPQAIAVDGSGDVWIANGDDVTVTELIGAAAPVVTPIAAGVQTNKIASRP